MRPSSGSGHSTYLNQLKSERPSTIETFGSGHSTYLNQLKCNDRSAAGRFSSGHSTYLNQLKYKANNHLISNKLLALYLTNSIFISK